MGSTNTRLDTLSSRPEPTAKEYHTTVRQALIVAAARKCVVTEKMSGLESPEFRWVRLHFNFQRCTQFEKVGGAEEKTTRR
jgi:hypothetical protein